MLWAAAAAFKTIEHSGQLDGIRVSLEYEMRCETHFRNYNLEFFSTFLNKHKYRTTVSILVHLQIQLVLIR